MGASVSSPLKSLARRTWHARECPPKCATVGRGWCGRARVRTLRTAHRKEGNGHVKQPKPLISGRSSVYLLRGIFSGFLTGFKLSCAIRQSPGSPDSAPRWSVPKHNNLLLRVVNVIKCARAHLRRHRSASQRSSGSERSEASDATRVALARAERALL